MSESRFAEMISKIAHELRSPLTSIKGFSATLVKRWDRFTDDQKLQFVETIAADAERMGRVVSEVLDLARIEAGRLELNSLPVDLSALIEKAKSNLQALGGIERVTVEVAAPGTIWVDKERFEHVMTNLLENAIKFSDEGPIEVRSRPDGDRIVISVSDRGVGIDRERVESIFTGPGPTGGQAGPSGTGLGLYLTRRLVEAHGGRIEVSSEPDVGSTFTIVLPPRS